jgi:hypothetical protein
MSNLAIGTGNESRLVLAHHPITITVSLECSILYGNDLLWK